MGRIGINFYDRFEFLENLEKELNFVHIGAESRV